MKTVLAIFALLLCSAYCARTDREYRELFGDFINTYNKTYATAEETLKRYIIFKNNLDFIDEHNAGNNSFTVAMNQFGDLSKDEFAAMYLGAFPIEWADRGVSLRNAPEPDVSALPDSWDWRTKGAVTHVKNQGQCGSCWSFSTTGSVEGCHFLTTGTLVSLSEQDLVDCSRKDGNDGCNGGLMDNAFKYIINNHGIDTEACYPYTARDGTCHYKASCCGSTVTSYQDVKSGSEADLQVNVYAAPTSVAIDASQSSFQFYSSGVYYSAECSSTRLDHGVLAVGYGATGGKDYWIVKNSWGSGWGMSGYILMSRNRSNNCGIATAASRPLKCEKCA